CSELLLRHDLRMGNQYYGSFRGRITRLMKVFSWFLSATVMGVVLVATAPLRAQDWVHTGTNLGNTRIRMAVADFKPVGADPETPALKATFDATLFGDLANAGIFDMVS